MPISLPEIAAMLPKLWRLFLLAVGGVCLSVLAVVVWILRNPEWHEHLLRLLGRAWDIFVAQDAGSTSRGFLSGCLEAVLGVAVVAVMTGYLLGWKEFRKHLVETAIIALFAFAAVTVIVYGTQFAWEVAQEGYKDHRSLVLDHQLIVLKENSQRKASEILNGQVEDLTIKLAEAEKRHPLPAERCLWQSFNPQLGPEVNGGISRTETWVMCSYELKAPYTISIDYEETPLNQLGGFLWPPDISPEGNFVKIGDKDIEVTVSSRSLPAWRGIMTSAYGKSGHPPKVLNLKINSLAQKLTASGGIIK